jgi:Tfp pilus assembly protein PilE
MDNAKYNRLEDKMPGKIIKNQRGMSIIGILIALAIVGALAHPKYSPFRHKYYAFVTQSDLKALHKECQKFWAFNISNGSLGDAASDFEVAGTANLFTAKAVKGNVRDSGSCDIESISKPPFKFNKNSSVSITIEDGDPDSFVATGKHINGDIPFKITSSGKVVES